MHHEPASHIPWLKAPPSWSGRAEEQEQQDQDREKLHNMEYRVLGQFIYSVRSTSSRYVLFAMALQAASANKREVTLGLVESRHLQFPCTRETRHTPQRYLPRPPRLPQKANYRFHYRLLYTTPDSSNLGDGQTSPEA
jgi:hypothetical protein